jgi:hypothetical protein
MDNVHLNPFAFSVDNSDLLEAFLLTFEKVVLQERGDLPGGKSMEVDPILDGNLNHHKSCSKLKAEGSKVKVSTKTHNQNSNFHPQLFLIILNTCGIALSAFRSECFAGWDGRW